MTKNGVDIDEILKESSKLEDSLFDDKYNKTTLFLLPMLGLDIKGMRLSKYLLNAFLDDKGFEHDYERPIFLLLKTKNFRENDYKDLVNIFRIRVDLKNQYLNYYYVGKDDNGYNLAMYVFKLDNAWKDDYYKFKQGKYSQFSKRAKALYEQEVKNSSGETIESILWGAVNKSENLKQYVKEIFFNEADEHIVDEMEEIWEAPNRKSEYFRYV